MNYRKVYQDEGFLRELHWNRGMSLREIGTRFGMSHKGISYWFDKHDIPKRGVGGQKRHATFQTAREYSGAAGYELWRTKEGGIDYRVRVHRLIAVAEYGLDKVKDMHVHHSNHITWDNRGSNIELMSPSDHASYHAQAKSEVA